MGGWNVGKHNQVGTGVTQVTIKAHMEGKYPELAGADSLKFWKCQLKRARIAWGIEGDDSIA